jgi:hypothetical protein
MNARVEPHGVDHPQLADTEGGVQRCLPAGIVGEAEIGDLNTSKALPPFKPFSPEFAS